MQTAGRPLSRLAKAGYIASTVMVVAAVVASLGAYAIYRRLDGNVSVVRVSGLSHRSVYERAEHPAAVTCRASSCSRRSCPR